MNKLRVLVVTEDDPIYVREFFGVFFPAVPREIIEIVGVTVCRAFREPLHKTGWRVLQFFGPLDTLRILPAFVQAKFGGYDISGLAERSGFALVETESVNSPDYIERAKALNPDVIISVAAPEIFKSDLLTVPRLGSLNIHSGKIPEYRGMMPTFWQMVEQQSHVTVTIHEMVSKLDSGGVVATIEFPLFERDSLDRVIRGTKREGARLMLDVLEEIARNERMPSSTPLDHSRARLFKFPTPTDVKRFKAAGHRIF
jgi:methionyl-tRNA formyltransferase